MAPKPAAANNKDGLKQGSLFSFFTKAASNNNKKNNNNNKASQQGSQSSSASTAAAKSNDDDNTIIQQVKIGTRVSVYWKHDEEYYTAVVRQINLPQYYLEYEQDGATEWLDLGQETFQILSSDDDRKESAARKRRLINDNDDDDDEFSEEAEFNDDDDDDDDDDSSAYKDNGAADKDDDEDDDLWMVTDDEDDQEVAASAVKKKTVAAAAAPNKKKQKTAVTVTQHAASSTFKRTPSTKSTTITTTTSLQQFGHSPKTVTPASTVMASRSPAMTTNQTSPLQSQTSSTTTSTPATTTTTTTSATRTTNNSTTNKPPAFVPNALNPAGSHVHNHLPFLQHPRDAAGRRPDHPDYDPRTLKVVAQDWNKVMGGKAMTDAVQQWWDLKAQYYDTVLLFKTGKFYELFHMDADVGVTVCGFNYMKGHVAHAGFPEISYGQFADQLVRAGYKVARVEQTETPEQLKERKKKKKGRSGGGGVSTKVVNREVCSVMTLGTRTFCYLDQSSGTNDFINHDKQGGSMSAPLLVIREVLLETPPHGDSTKGDDDDEQVQPVCEYGITLVDAVRGAVTIGQFADDCLRSRMTTLLTAFCPCEILISETASPTLQSLIKTFQKQSPHPCQLEIIRTKESFPKSTALDASIRSQMNRGPRVHPWDVQETLAEVHRRKYYPCASKKVQQEQDQQSVSRWPKVLRAAVEGNAELALSSFGAALFYLQRSLIDVELLSMGIVKAYIPPSSLAAEKSVSSNAIQALAMQESRKEAGILTSEDAPLISPTQQQQQVPPTSAAGYSTTSSQPTPMDFEEISQTMSLEEQINHMVLDGTTLHNLEILTNSVDFKIEGSLWSKINYTKTPHGARLLRAWLLRPLFRKADIERRVDAVEELASGAAAVALSEATSVLAKCGDIERLLSRVHSMSGSAAFLDGDNEGGAAGIHPNERAILYETGTYTKRKVGDFSRVLNGLRCATQIPEIFDGIEFRSGLLRKIVSHADNGGCFPDMTQELDWFFSNFDCDMAAKGLFEPTRGVDAAYDEACETIERIHAELDDYKNEMCSDVLSPRALAKSSWKYANTKPESKDKFMIELPVNVAVPDDFIMKGKRGSGHKQVNKYRTAVLDELVVELELALDIQKERKARGMQLIFAKFDSMRNLWAAAAQATSLLDALSSMAHVASKAGYTRPMILDCPPDSSPSIKVTQGRHPCVEKTASISEFVPNDLSLGSMAENGPEPRVLLLSGPNMGGKSTLLRQTCLIAILAQMGSYVPAEACELTPIDRIYTRLGASDRILLGQSTFFVELAETAAALRGANRRSLCIFDELGRGTSTFDGTAIASASVKHLVERSQCLSLFATHYHSLLDEWKQNPSVRLGHMECVVENGNVTDRSGEESETNITFLYTLGSGTCPKSFGINVARLAGLPEDVLVNAKRISAEFEQEMNGDGSVRKSLTARTAPGLKKEAMAFLEAGDWAQLQVLWEKLKES